MDEIESSGPKSQDETADHRNDRQNSGTGTNVVTPTPQYPTAPNKSKCSDHNSKPFWKRVATYQFIMEIALFAVGVKVACIYSGQLAAMRDSNEISRESLTSVQRAFVSFQHFEYFRLQDPNSANVHNWDFLADFENNGATNAINVIGTLQVQELPAEPTDEQFRGNYTHLPAITIPPKATRATRIPRPVPEPLIFGVDLGPVTTAKSTMQGHYNRNLFVWSWVYYRDVFPKTKPHVTEFCSQLTGIHLVTQNYNPLANPLIPGNLNFTYAGCGKHNCDDEQCKDYQAIVNAAEKP